MEKMACNSSFIRPALCSACCSARSTVAINSLINSARVHSRYLNLDSYHGTHFAIAPPSQRICRSASADLISKARHAITADAGNSGRFSGAKLSALLWAGRPRTVPAKFGSVFRQP